MDWLKTLNEEQRQAVETVQGPLLIVAGPGTGKTKTLTTRITYLIQNGHAAPSEVLALTFTKKAAEEMRERINALLPSAMPVVTTFHALCRQLLPGGRDIRFIDDHERTILIKQLRKSVKFGDLTTRELALEISRLKNLPPNTPITDASMRQLLDVYNQALKERSQHDFDDLLLQAYDFLRRTKTTLPYRYILVDEFQDTNLLQYELLQLLKQNDNICVIGDPLQSIYGFRGAGDDMFERFKADFPTAHKAVLTTNYRSRPQIVKLANMLFKDTASLTAATSQTGHVQAVEVLNEYSEAAWIVDSIEQSVGGSDFLRSHQFEHDTQTQRTFGDFAVLYRTHHSGKAIQRRLYESGIPFQIVGDGSPYEQPDVWAIMQIMDYLAHPSDEQEAALGSLAALRKLSSSQIRILLDRLRMRPLAKVSRLALEVAAEFGLTSKETNWLSGVLVRFDTRGIEAFSRYLSMLDMGQFYDPNIDAVSLMTIHAAKGLEFNHVFLIAAEENILPHQRVHGQTNVDEEKRLFYVAITRAKEQLDILHAKTRAGKSALLSRFVEELDHAMLPRVGDAAMSADERRLKKRKAKRSQTTLFDF